MISSKRNIKLLWKKKLLSQQITQNATPPALVFTTMEMWYVFISFLHQQAIHLIEEMDQDGDGQISEAEVLKNQDTFLNSEVTDYGRQLHVSHDEL